MNSMLAVATVTADTVDVELVITPLTHMAATSLGISFAEDAGVDSLPAGTDGLNPEVVDEANTAVAEAYGISGGNVATDLPVLVIDDQGNTTQGNAYGVALGLVSALEAGTAETFAATLAAIGSDMTGNGALSEALKGELVSASQHVDGVTREEASEQLGYTPTSEELLARVGTDAWDEDTTGHNNAGLTAASLNAVDGVSGAMKENVDAYEAYVDANPDEFGAVATPDEIQAMIEQVNDVAAVESALETIEAYNNGDGTTPAALSVQDYIDADITGVTEDNLDAVNARVLAAATDGADSVDEVQALVDAAIAELDAVADVVAAAAAGTTDAAELTAAGVETDAALTAEQLEAVNDALDAAAATDPVTSPTTPEELQALVDEAIAETDVVAIVVAESANDAPTQAELTAAGVTQADLTDDQLAAIDDALEAAAATDPVTSPTTPAELQTLVDGIYVPVVEAAAASGEPTQAQLSDAGVTQDDLTPEQLAAIDDALDATAAATPSESLTSPEELQALVDEALAELDAVAAVVAAAAAGTTDAAELAAAGVETDPALTAEQIEAVNNALDAAAATNPATSPTTPEELQALVNTAVADRDTALAKIEAYNNGDGTKPVALSVQDYVDAGITGVSADNLAAVNAQVLAADTGGADTMSEVQAHVTAANAALATIEAYNNGDGTTPAALTAADYTAAGITGLDADNLAAVNTEILGAATGEADTVAEIQALVASSAPAATIDLSGTDFGGQLIAPIEVMIDGVNRVFYFWDRNGDGLANTSFVGGVTDFTTHNFLDTLFNSGSDTTDDIGNRSFTMTDGTILRLPTLGTSVGRDVDDDEVVSSPSENQTVLDDLAAIKDAFDGSGTGDGAPPDWASSKYWSATSTGAGSHAFLYSSGSSLSGIDTGNAFVALEVI